MQLRSNNPFAEVQRPLRQLTLKWLALHTLHLQALSIEEYLKVVTSSPTSSIQVRSLEVFCCSIRCSSTSTRTCHFCHSKYRQEGISRILCTQQYQEQKFPSQLKRLIHLIISKPVCLQQRLGVNCKSLRRVRLNTRRTWNSC